LGTPASGTVTNLTGTASININGTVGATTPSTGAFTTLSASGDTSLAANLTLSGGATGAIINLNANSGVTQQIKFQQAGTNKWQLYYETANGNLSLYDSTNATNRWSASSTGLAVTGSLIATASGDRAVEGVQTRTTGINYASVFQATGSGATFNTGAYINASGGTTNYGVRIVGPTSGANNYAIYSDAAAQSYFAGNVGIGTSSPAAKLESSAASVYNTNGTEALRLSNSGNLNKIVRLGYDSSLNAGFITVGTIGSSNDPLLLNPSGGNVGIATTTPYSPLNVLGTTSAAGQAYGSSIPGSVGQISIHSTDAYTSQKGGKISLSGVSGTGGTVNVTTYGTIEGYKVNASNNNAGGGLLFSTTLNASGTLAEKMRLDDSGNLLVGTTSTLPMDGAARFSADGSGTNYPAANLRGDSAQWALKIGTVDTTSTRYMIAFCNNTSSSLGGITTNGTIVIYGGTSDYRLKDITGPLTNSGTFIDSLKPKVGSWKSDGSKFVGFLAHEFAEVSPTSVTGEKDAVDAEGNPKYQGMQAGSAEVIANLVAELQSLRQRVAALETR
jgi:hypothetical protein